MTYISLFPSLSEAKSIEFSVVSVIVNTASLASVIPASEASEILTNYEWKGNVRELANVVERAVILAQGNLIGVENLPPDFRGEPASPIPASDSFEESIIFFKKQLILNALQESGNNKAEAARKLKISRTYLFRLLNQLGIR